MEKRLNITPIPAFRDNYIWCLSLGKSAWVVDPGDATPVLAHLEATSLSLEGILVTHHHPDHTGGICRLSERFSPRVIGPDNARIQGLTQRVGEGDSVNVLDCHFTVMEVPGHTLDHLAFFTSDHSPPLLFCGDTLFSAGCGRLFEGTALQMFESLRRIGDLPVETLLFPTHEYTLPNLAFAHAVAGDLPAIEARLEECRALRLQGQPTLPVTLSAEFSYNPFLMTDNSQIQTSVNRHTGLHLSHASETFAALRRWKDEF